MTTILREIEKYRTRYVVVTGGEPMLAQEIEELARELKARGAHITAETAATIYKPIVCDLMSLSPKLANSTPLKKAGGRFAKMHEARRLNLPVIRRYVEEYDYQLKFVVEQRTDFEEIRALLDQLSHVDPARVLIMPQGTQDAALRRKAKWIVELCKEHGYRFAPRLHIQLFGNQRGI